MEVFLRWALLFMGLTGAFGSAFASGQVTLAWDASADPLVSGYNVYYGRKSGSYTHVVKVNDTSVTIRDLDEGSAYYFALTSSYIEGMESDFAPEIYYQVPRTTPAGSNWVAQLNATYSGLISEDEAQPKTSGAVSLAVGSRGAYSGLLRLAGRTYGFTGRLDAHGSTTRTLKLNGQSASLHLRVGTGDERDQLFGDVTGSSWTAKVVGARRVFNAATNPAPSRGVYTLAVAPDSSDPQSPEGYGYGVARVSPGGSVWFAAALADGAKVTWSSLLCAGSRWPIYLPLYRAGGVLFNWLAFTQQNNSDISGSLTWIRPSLPQATWYRQGFTNSCVIIASAYHAPSSATKPLLEPKQVVSAFSGGNLVEDLAIPLQLGADGAVEDLSNAGVSMHFMLTTGLFHGRLKDPANGGHWNFGGAVLLNANRGFGALFGPDKTSRVMIGQ